MNEDEWQALLGPGITPVNPAGIAPSLRLVQRRGRLRRLRQASVTLAAFLAGAACVVYFRPPAEVITIERIVAVPAEKTDAIASTHSHKQMDAAPPAQVPQTAGELERLAIRTLDAREAAALYRRAGNRYFDTERNIEAALRCYTQMLRLAEPSQLQRNPEDSSLLTSLILDRQTEKPRAKNDD